MVKSRQNQPQYDSVPKLSKEVRRDILSTAIRSDKVFTLFNGRLSPTDVAEFDLGLGVLWSIAAKYYESYGELPDEETYLKEFFQRAKKDPDSFPTSRRKKVVDLLSKSFDRRLKAIDRNMLYYRHNGKQLLVEETLRKLVARSGMDQSGLVPENPAAVSREITRELEQLQTLSIDINAIQVLDGEWNEDYSGEPITTGVDLLDKYTGGGSLPGEVICLLGGYGSCKTTLAVQIGSAQAKFHYQDGLRTGDKTKAVTLYFFYESSKEEMRIRYRACAAQIPKDNLASADIRLRLSGKHNPKDYEKRLFSSTYNTRFFRGEQDRLKAIEDYREYVYMFDMAGSDPNMGKGGFSEIVSVCETFLLQRKDCRIANVIVDYVGAMVNRSLSNSNVKDVKEAKRDGIGLFALRAKTEIGSRFGATVYGFHQLTTDANRFPVHKLPDTTDSAEARNFGENADFVFCIGKPSKSNLSLFGTRKSRRQGRQDPSILQIHGEIGYVTDVTDEYVLTSTGFISQEESEMAASDAELGDDANSFEL